jgi:hypothetical protein
MALFSSKKSKPKNVYVLLDSTTSRVLARGTSESPPEMLNIQLNIAVVNAENLQIVPADEEQPPKLGHVIHRQGNLVVLEPTRILTGTKVRENLRMPVDFDTFIYPANQEGRFYAKSNDLSCGGISFYCDGEMAVGDRIEVVIPITRVAPLLMVCQILRKTQEEGSKFYAAKFLNLLSEQESMIREAVFSVQLRVMQRMQR